MVSTGGAEVETGDVGCQGCAGVVAERMWHASEEIVPIKPDGSVIEFRARLSGLEEITRWVLNWGSKAQVLGPVALKKGVKGP